MLDSSNVRINSDWRPFHTQGIGWAWLADRSGNPAKNCIELGTPHSAFRKI
jgi:hypothetical protein